MHSVSSPTPLCIQTEHEVRQRLPCKEHFKFVKGFQIHAIHSRSTHWNHTTILKHVNSPLPSPTCSTKNWLNFLRPITRSTVLFVLKASRWHWTFQRISTHFNACWWHDCARLLHAQPMQLPPRSLWDIWNLQEDLVPSASWSGPWLNCHTDMATRCHCKVTRLHTNRASHFPWRCEANGKEARVAWVLTEPSITQLKPSDTFGTFPYLWNPPRKPAQNFQILS